MGWLSGAVAGDIKSTSISPFFLQSGLVESFSSITPFAWQGSLFLSSFSTNSSRILQNGYSCSFFERLELNLFLIASLVLPLISFAMLLQLLPYIQNRRTIFRSSSSVHLDLLTHGSKCLNQRSLHWREILPGNCSETLFQLLTPNFFTRSVSILSSYLVQFPVMQLLMLFISSQRVWHLISDFPGMRRLMLHHELVPK